MLESFFSERQILSVILSQIWMFSVKHSLRFFVKYKSLDFEKSILLRDRKATIRPKFQKPIIRPKRQFVLF